MSTEKLPAGQAIAWLDHHSAKVMQFDDQHVQVQKVQAHTHDTGHHGSSVRTEHEFYGEVCDELAAIGQIVVAGSQTALSDFRHYVNKHRMPLAQHILAWETVDSPTEPQLVAMARKYFAERAAGAAPKAK